MAKAEEFLRYNDLGRGVPGNASSEGRRGLRRAEVGQKEDVSGLVSSLSLWFYSSIYGILPLNYLLVYKTEVFLYAQSFTYS